MHSKIVCSRCRQKIAVTANLTSTTILQCTTCRFEQKVSAFGGVNRDEANGTLVRGHATKAGDGSNFVSLNYKPSALEVAYNKPNKRAVLIGVSYNGWKHKLDGTINDVKSMRDCLICTFGFSAQNILVLTEEEPRPEHYPTKRNIQKSLKWLMEGCQAGNSLVFFFSGHGLRQPDFTGEELDGYDETICPVDFKKEGMITDNELFDTLVAPLPKGALLHAFVDACHSGTILDLQYVYNRVTTKWEDQRAHIGQYTSRNGGLAISITACQDDQIAADTSAFDKRMMNGAMTYILADILKKKPTITYGELLNRLHMSIEEANRRGGYAKRVLRRIFNARLLQKPQLSSSVRFDVYSKQFRL